MSKSPTFTVLVDTREQTPFRFNGWAVERRGLVTGDYSIDGLSEYVAIERKTIQDLVGCVGSCRDRFKRELHRLQGYPLPGRHHHRGIVRRVRPPLSGPNPPGMYHRIRCIMDHPLPGAVCVCRGPRGRVRLGPYADFLGTVPGIGRRPTAVTPGRICRTPGSREDRVIRKRLRNA